MRIFHYIIGALLIFCGLLGLVANIALGFISMLCGIVFLPVVRETLQNKVRFIDLEKRKNFFALSGFIFFFTAMATFDPDVDGINTEKASVTQGNVGVDVVQSEEQVDSDGEENNESYVEPMTGFSDSQAVDGGAAETEVSATNQTNEEPSPATEGSTGTIQDSEPEETIAESQSSPEPVNYCSADTYNCGDFFTHSEAQSIYDSCIAVVGYDIHRLDQDDDGVACETLP